MHKKSFLQNLFLVCLISYTTSYSMKEKVNPLALEKEIEAILSERILDDYFQEDMRVLNKKLKEQNARVDAQQPDAKNEQKNPNQTH